MTYREAIEAGYEPVFSSYFLGYISRKTNLYDQEVYEAGGYRKGLYYAEGPNWNSTTYSIRHYLRKPKAI